MKLLITSAVSLLFAAQLRAQQVPSAPVAPTYATTRNYVSQTVTYQDPQEDQDGPGKTKSITKSFSVDRNDKVNIANTFGTVTVKTWDKNEVRVDATINAFGNNDSDAQKLLDGVTVEMNKSGDVVAVKTEMEERNGNWGRGSRNGKSWIREIKTNITVYMPSRNPLTVSHQYGNVTTDDLAGATSFKVQYGNLTTGDLSSANNVINVQYGKTTLQNINQADVKVQYGSGLTIATINNLDLQIQYASVNIGSVKGSGQMKVQYGGGVKIGTAGNLNVNTQYAGLNIGKLSGNLTSKAQYSRVNVDQVENGVKIIAIDAQYTPVALGLSDGYNADFNVKTSYGSLKYPSGTEVKNIGDPDDRTSKNYVGKIGRGGSGNINITSTYNSVIFK